MRTLQVPLAGAVSVMLALLASLVVTAQDAQPSQAPETDEPLPPYAGITGRVVPGHQVGSFDTVMNPEPPKEAWRGWSWNGRYATNDPRLSCDFVINQNADHFEPGWSGGAVRTGIGRCENEGGYWTFESVGFTKPGVSITAGNYYAQVYTGHDGYAGLTALLFFIPSPGHVWDIEGVIAPGPLPEPPTSLEPGVSYD